jgi:hypothetical protein
MIFFWVILHLYIKIKRGHTLVLQVDQTQKYQMALKTIKTKKHIKTKLLSTLHS